MRIPQHIKNIVFDLGGVLCGLDAERCIRAFHQIGADEVAVYVKEHRVEDLFLQSELGYITTEQFCDEVRRITQRPLEDEQIVWAWNELLTGITDERWQAVLRLAKDYRLFILSNTNEMHWGKWLLEERESEGTKESVFEKCFLSYELHLAKPSREIFEAVLQQADIKAEETLFIDDSLVNCQAAEALGIHTYYNKHINDWIAREQVATIGFFDGVHRGHRYLIDQMIAVAKEAEMESTVITFDRHPRQVLHSDYQPQMLSTFEEKKALLAQTPADHIEVLPFDEQLAALSAREFMDEVLRKRLNVRKLVIGYDNRFGHNRSESFEDYVRYGQELGIEVIQAMPLGEQTQISSSYIRACLLVGNVNGANEALGYAYSLTGTVTEGFHEGRKIGFPTANLNTDETGKLVPAPGVYAVHVQLENEQHLRLAMMNIGTRPTYDGHMQTLEVHIFDFNGDIYGQQLRVLFDRRIRNEMKFSSPQELAKQLEKDKEEVRRIYA